MNKLMTRLLHGMVKKKVFIVDTRESAARGIYKRPEPGEKGVD